MIQAKAKPSAKKIPRAGSNKIPRTENASAGSAHIRGDHSRPAGVLRLRGDHSSQHREGQEEPSQEMSQCGSTGREYDGDIRVRAGQVPILRTNIRTDAHRTATPSPGAQARLSSFIEEAHTERQARKAAKA